MSLRNLMRCTPRTWHVPAMATLLAALIASPAAAQQVTVSGRIVDAASGQPLAGATVTAHGTNARAFADETGTYTLVVPAGTHEFEVALLGYRTVRRSVTIAAGAATRLDFELEVSAVRLDQIVVSGRATGTAQREIGAAITVINTEEIEAAPIQNVSQLLQARVPGLHVQQTGGNAGQGSRIVLRGVTSASQNVEPLIYVDGVRMDNHKETDVSTNAMWSGLDDLDPADIERIEIVKGAAAATLYGTEASAGVIQIFTKQGRGDGQTWQFSTQYGFNHTPLDYWNVSIYSPWFYDHFVRTGTQQSHNLSLSGMLDGFSYRLSGSWRANEGVLVNSHENARSFRANMRLTPSERLGINVNTGYYWRSVRYPEEGNNGASYAYNALRGGPRGINYESLELIDARERISNIGRFTASTSISFSPIESFSHRLTVGAEVSNSDNWRFEEYGSVYDENGEMYNMRRESITLNLDYTARLQLQLTPAIGSRTALGFQAYKVDVSRTRATGTSFAGPGLRSIIGAGGTTGFEGRTLTVSAGYFGEQQFSFHDIFFLTFGLRADGHSAFGESVGYTLYPKVDASYVISDQDFWPKRFGTLRLRTAYGTAGMQPGAYDSERTWDPTESFDGLPAFVPGNLGNPDLRPEISHEFEAGFDWGLWNERVGIQYTHYRQKTTDGLYDKPYPPSQGFLAPQLSNVAEIKNTGHELSVNARLIDGRDFRVTGFYNLSTNDNVVTSLGGSAPFELGTNQWSQWIREGHPLGAFFERRYVMRDGELVKVEDDYIGQPFPKYNMSMGMDVGLGRSISINVLLSYKGGHHISSSTSRWLSVDRVRPGDPLYDPSDPSTARFAPNAPVGVWCIAPDDPIDEKRCTEDWSLMRGNHIYPADSWRLREVSVQYQLPPSIRRMLGVSRGYISLAGRNLWRYQPRYPGLEAEANFSSITRLGNQSYFDTPIPRSVVARLSVTF